MVLSPSRTRIAVRLLQLVPLAAAIALCLAAGASALPPVCETDCPDPGPGMETITPGLWVTAPSSGLIQDSPQNFINCSPDCSQPGTSFSYTRTCDETGCSDSGVDSITLVASGGPAGFSPSWQLCRANGSGTCLDSTRFACDSSTGGNCGVDMTDNTRVQMTWMDTTDPNTSFSSPPGVVGPAVKTFAATATDNAGVSTVQFAIDGVFVGNDTSAPFQWDVNPNAYTDGSTHTITARAIDTSGRQDATPASTNFTVDRSTQIAISSPDAGSHSQSAPEFSFSIEPGATATCRTLAGLAGDTMVGSPSSCTSSYSPEATAPGDYRVRISSTDAVGNSATVERAFTIDAPPGDQPQNPGDQPQNPGQQPGGSDPGTGGNTVTLAAILAALDGDLKSAAAKLSAQKQRKLVKARGKGLSVHALTAGTFVLTFKGQATKAKAARSVTIAKGRTVAAGAGTYTLKLKLTKAGTRVLRLGKRVKGKLTLSFTPAGGSKASRSRAVTLKRR